MRRMVKCLLLVIVALVSIGCGATARMIDYGSMKTDVAMSQSIFLTPTEAPKTIYVQIRNTSSNQNITSAFESTILSQIQAKGCQVCAKPSEATYILQANIRYLGEWRQGMSFEGTLTGSGIGALAGLGIGAGPHGSARGAAIGGGVGGVIGAGLGFAADMATRVRTEIIVVEFQITERLSEEEDITGQQTTGENRMRFPVAPVPGAPIGMSGKRTVTSAKPGTKIYTGGVAARAAQVNLNVNEAAKQLIQVAGLQIAGIFPKEGPGNAPQPQVAPPAPTAAPSRAPSVTSAPLQPLVKVPEPEPRIVYVKWPTASLREGPGTNFKAVAEVKKGTSLVVLDDKDQWLLVGLEDGREGWIGKATTSETP
jgi:uncharacterized protein YgiM (DUF1202 family)